MKTYDFAIYGNNPGALIAALELAQTHEVVLVNPSSNWGAHFGGYSFRGETFDLGMNFLEFTTFHKSSSDILSYNPAVRNDSARFFEWVANYITNRLNCTQVDKIEVLCKGIYAKDIVMANALEILRNLPEATFKEIESELKTIISNGNSRLHASQKKLNEDLFLSTSYYDVSLANHGITFHSLFIEPFCKKIFNTSSKDIPALLHRIAWAPLFYPETLLDGLCGTETLPPTLFHYPEKGSFSAIIDVLTSDVKKQKNITVIGSKITQVRSLSTYEIECEEGTISSKHLVWCNDLSSLLKSAKIDLPVHSPPRKASVTLALCLVDNGNIKRHFSTLYVSDSQWLIYRITNQTFSAKDTSETNQVKLTLEFNHDAAIEAGFNSKQELLIHINQFLLQNDILKIGLTIENVDIKILKDAITLPTLSNLANFKHLLNLTTDNLPNVELIGSASGFASTSFNDQVVQALRLGVKYKNNVSH